MVDFTTINNAGEIAGVFLKTVPTTSYDNDNNEIISYLGGLGYSDNLPLNMVIQVTNQVVPNGEPYFILLRNDIPFDYDINSTFIASLDFDNPDGYGTGI